MWGGLELGEYGRATGGGRGQGAGLRLGSEFDGMPPEGQERSCFIF